MIPIGTVCYLVRNVDFAWLNGRVASVVGYDVDENGATWHVLNAPWIPEAFGSREIQSQEFNLLPIDSPGVSAAKPRSRATLH